MKKNTMRKNNGHKACSLEGLAKYLTERIEKAKWELAALEGTLAHVQEKGKHKLETFCLEGGGWITVCKDCDYERNATEAEYEKATSIEKATSVKRK